MVSSKQRLFPSQMCQALPRLPPMYFSFCFLGVAQQSPKTEGKIRNRGYEKKRGRRRLNK